MIDFNSIEDDELSFNAVSSFNEVEFYGEKELRWYQIAARNAIAEALEQGHKRILVTQPTGSGKTLTIAASMSCPRIRRALGIKSKRPLRVMFVAHKHRLLTQAERTFINENEVELILQSMFSEISVEVLKEGWDIAICDEAHHEACQSFQLHLDNIGERPLIGLTATCDRADRHVIKFDPIINPISREQAVEEGWLAPTYINSIVDAPSVSKVPVTKMVIDEFGHEFGQTMMFFRTKKEVSEITEYLTTKGYKAIAILNQTEKELDRILDAFSRGENQFVVNCAKINEGVDVKGCTDVYLGRAYGSYPMLNQVIGRAARPDSPCNVWELINPLSSRNLDTSVVVGTPERHRLISKQRGKWIEQDFDYVGNVGGDIHVPENVTRIQRI